MITTANTYSLALPETLFSPRWQTLEALNSSPDRFAQWVQPWLKKRGSLTEHLRRHTQHSISVKLLTHQMKASPAQAHGALSLDPNEAVLHRAVLLCKQDTPLVFAYSLIPESVLDGRYANLKHLGEQPLGHWLFKEPALQRQPMSVAVFTAAELGLTPLTGEVEIAARRSLFHGALKPLCVTEFFLAQAALS